LVHPIFFYVAFNVIEEMGFLFGASKQKKCSDREDRKERTRRNSVPFWESVLSGGIPPPPGSLESSS